MGLVLYEATQALAGIPMHLTPRIVGLSLLLTTLIGLVSAVFTLEKVRRDDPAELF